MKISNIANGEILKNQGVNLNKTEQKKTSDFMGLLEKNIKELNNKLQGAEKLAIDLAAGKELDLPTVMTAINKADLSFRMFLQVRNKALSAYEEIMRLQF